jgi:hypothetical protein
VVRALFFTPLGAPPPPPPPHKKKEKGVFLVRLLDMEEVCKNKIIFN